jgi:hypothetical protein
LDKIGLALLEAARRRQLLADAMAGAGMRLVIDCSFPHLVRSPAEVRVVTGSLTEQR